MPYKTTPSERDGKYEIGISVKGTFGEVFELPNLLHDHLSYVNAVQYVDKGKIYSEIKSLIASLMDKNISDYLDYDYANPQTVSTTILVGLMLGYPVETTASVLFF